MAEQAAGLVARTRRLDSDVDLVGFAREEGFVFEREGHGLAGRGTALTIPLPTGDATAVGATVSAALGAIERDDEVGCSGCGPVAFGALPFDPTAQGMLVVPEVIVGRAEDGTRWVTTITPQGAGVVEPHEVDLAPVVYPDSEVDPGRISVRAARPAQEWCEALAAGRVVLRSGGALRKFVLAREVIVEFDRPIQRSVVLARLRTSFPGCYITAVGAMVGASPELLLSRHNDIVRSRPMAGTAPRSSDPTVDSRLAASLLASAKDREEHQITIDMVHDTLLPWCSYLDAEAEPSIAVMANVQHLATYLEGRLSTPAASAIALVTALHPTPAVCGSPTAEALALIRRLETADRGSYAGPVGWVDSSGDGEWAVGIRSAQLGAQAARVFAGVGVVADSEPEVELAETRSKLQAVLSALVRP